MVFFREISSGHNLNAYMIALYLTNFIEIFFNMLVCSGVAYLLRNSLTLYTVFLLNFSLLAWVGSGWSYLLYPILPRENNAAIMGCFLTFTCISMSGAFSPYEYEQIYSSKFNQLLTGFISPTRFFQESLIVSEFKWYVFIHLLCCLRYTVELID